LKEKRFDITGLGELLIDFTESGHSAGGQRLFEQNPGGAVPNCLTAAARYGLRTAFIGKVGNDMHGLFLRDTLAQAGIDVSGMIIADDVFTTLAFVALSASGEREFSFARKPGADTCLRPQELDRSIVCDTRVLHIGSLSLTDEPARTATMDALRLAKESGALISYDPNYRATLWPSKEEAVEGMRSALPFADIIKIADNEIGMITGSDDPKTAAETLLAGGAKLVSVTLGKRGAFVASKNASVLAPAFDIPAVDTTGAGDAFCGGMLYKLLTGGKDFDALTQEDLGAYGRFANATATMCVQKRGGIPSMPKLADTEGLLASGKG